MPVKSEIFIELHKISPPKAVASLTCISPSPLMLIALFPTKYALKLASGMYTFCPTAFKLKAANKSVIKYLIIKFMIYIDMIEMSNFLLPIERERKLYIYIFLPCRGGVKISI